jgi:uncharacterized DUF497 family protein
MKFKYNESKSKSNKEKHGVDFEDAKLVWEDEERTEVKTLFSAETRYINIGKINNKLYTVVITYRDENIRIKTKNSI